MKVRNTKVLMPAISVAILALGGGYYGLQLANNQNNLPKALAYTSTINPVDPSTAPDDYEIKLIDEIKHAVNYSLNLSGYLPVRDIDSPITVGIAKNLKRLGVYPQESENLEGLQYFTNLSELYVSDSPKLKDMSAIYDLKKLTTLDIRRTNIKDISFLKNLKQLETIYIQQNPITDFSPILGWACCRWV